MKSLKDLNIILITLDGFRKDKIDLCPALKSFKEKSYYFSKMNVAAPYTFASHHAIFSGMYPSRNGVNGYYNMFKFKKDEIFTLTQLLKKAGFYTVSETCVETVLPRQGFDEYNIFDEVSVNLPERHKDLIRRLSKKGKFFAFLHNVDTHLNFVRLVIQKYEKEVNEDDYFLSKKTNDEKYNSILPSCDNYISTILKTLEECGLAEKTVVIIISDHGTNLGEKRGERFYGVYVYDNTINVFCIMNIPGDSPQIINKQCRTIDLFPTIAEIAGISLGEECSKVQGESLFQLINDSSAKEREVFVETGGLYGPWPSPAKHNVFCVKASNKKLIYNDTPKTWEFYDLKNDPEELNNIYNEKSEEVKYFKSRLLYYLQENDIVTNLTSL